MNKKYGNIEIATESTATLILSKIESFFANKSHFEIVEFPKPEKIIPDLLMRNLYDRKPYNNAAKDSMRDTLIWNSYKNHAESNILTQTDDCVFVSNNTDDFTQAVLDEWGKLIHHKSIWTLIPALMQSKGYRKDLYEIITAAQIDETFIEKYLDDKLTPNIESYLGRRMTMFPLAKIDRAFRDGEAEYIDDFRYGNITYIEKYVSGDVIFVPFNIIIYQKVAITLHNYDYEDGMPLPYSRPHEYELELEVLVLSKYSKEDGIYDCEVDTVEFVGAH
jgi:hypothetical protein